MNRAILLISCADQKGITAAVTGFIAQNNGNIIHADQHIDEQTNTFFMRVEWALEGFIFQAPEDIRRAFNAVSQKFSMNWELNVSSVRPRAALFVSRRLHCLQDLLIRHKAGQFECDIPVIISNHADAKILAKEFGIRFTEFHVSKDNKAEIERQQAEILNEEKIDVIILAQYHQILTAGFVRQFSNRIINIHHSFLPAFVGENPYLQAYKKGVKIIGATSHYVIEDLDAGPIIEQDTVRVSHRDALEDMVRKGEDLEKVVLSRAVRWHLQKKILCYGNKTVVFD
jgi:formyltetrahydrofolate deformylase